LSSASAGRDGSKAASSATSDRQQPATLRALFSKTLALGDADAMFIDRNCCTILLISIATLREESAPVE
jgi:hypothetical protein